MDPINALLNGVPTLHSVDTWLSVHGTKIQLDKVLQPLLDKVKSLRSEKESAGSGISQLMGALRILHTVVVAQKRPPASPVSGATVVASLPHTVKLKDLAVRVEGLALLAAYVKHVTGTLETDETKYFFKSLDSGDATVRAAAARGLGTSVHYITYANVSELDSIVLTLLKFVDAEKSPDVVAALHESLGNALGALCALNLNQQGSTRNSSLARRNESAVAMLRLGKIPNLLSKPPSQVCIDIPSTLTFLGTYFVKRPTRFFGEVSFPTLVKSLKALPHDGVDASASVASLISSLPAGSVKGVIDGSRQLQIMDGFATYVTLFPAAMHLPLLQEIVAALPSVNEDFPAAVLWRCVAVLLEATHPFHSVVHETMLEVLLSAVGRATAYLPIVGLTLVTFVRLCSHMGPKIIANCIQARCPAGILCALAGASSHGIHYHDRVRDELERYAEELHRSANSDGLAYVIAGSVAMFGPIKSELLLNSVLSLPANAVLQRLVMWTPTLASITQLVQEHTQRGSFAATDNSQITRNVAVFYALVTRNLPTAIHVLRSSQGSATLALLIKGALNQFQVSSTHGIMLTDEGAEGAEFSDLDLFTSAFGLHSTAGQQKLCSIPALERQVLISATQFLSKIYVYQNSENRAVLVTKVTDIFFTLLKGGNEVARFAVASNVVEWLALTLQAEDSINVANSLAFKSIMMFLVEGLLGKSYSMWATKYSVALHNRVCDICSQIGRLDMENLTSFLKVATFKASHLPTLLHLHKRFNVSFLTLLPNAQQLLLPNAQQLLSAALKGEQREDILLAVHAMSLAPSAGYESFLCPLFDVFVSCILSNRKMYPVVAPGTASGDETNLLFLESYMTCPVKSGTLSGEASLRRLLSVYGLAVTKVRNELDDLLDGAATGTACSPSAALLSLLADWQSLTILERLEAVKVLVDAEVLPDPRQVLTMVLNAFKHGVTAQLQELYGKLIIVLRRVVLQDPSLLEEYQTQVEFTIRDALRSTWPSVVLEACTFVKSYPASERKPKLLVMWLNAEALGGIWDAYSNFGVHESVKVAMAVLGTLAIVASELTSFEVSTELKAAWLNALDRYVLEARTFGTAYNDIARTLSVSGLHTLDSAWSSLRPTLAEWLIFVLDTGSVTSIQRLPFPESGSAYTLPPMAVIHRFVRPRLMDRAFAGILAWFASFKSLSTDLRCVILNALISNKCITEMGELAATTFDPEDIACFLSMSPTTIPSYGVWLRHRRTLPNVFAEADLLEIRALVGDTSRIANDTTVSVEQWCTFFTEHAALTVSSPHLTELFGKVLPRIAGAMAISNSTGLSTELCGKVFDVLEKHEKTVLCVALPTYMCAIQAFADSNVSFSGQLRERVQNCLVRNAAEVKDLFGRAPPEFVQEIKSNLIAKKKEIDQPKLNFGGINIGAFARHSVKRESEE